MHKSNSAEAVYLFAVLGLSYWVLDGMRGFAQGGGSIIKFLLCTAISVLVFLLCSSPMGEKDIFDIVTGVYGKKVSFVLMTIILGITLANAGVRLGIYTDAVSGLILKKTPPEVISAIFCVCAFLVCRQGIKAISIYSLVIFIFLILMLAVILAFSASEIKQENVFALAGDGAGANTFSMLYVFSDAVYVFFAFKGKALRKSPAVIGAVTGLICTVLTVFYILCVPYTSAPFDKYPLYTLASLANTSVIFQRLDGLVFIIWFFCGFVSIGALSLFAAEIFARNFSVSDRKAVSAPIVLIVFLLNYNSLVDKKILFYTMTAVTFVLLPLTVLLYKAKTPTKKLSGLLSLVLCMVLLSGCYDYKEIDTLATVLAVSVDQSDEGRTYTFSIADVKEKDSGDGSGVLTLRSSGENIQNAIDSLSDKISRKLSFSHLSAILFSTVAAESGMYKEIEYFNQKVSVRPQTYIAVVDGKASVFIEENVTRLQPNAEKYFEGLLNKKEKNSRVMHISDFLSFYRGGKNVHLPVIVPGEEKEGGISFIREGVVIKGKLVSVTDNKTER